MIQLKPFYAGLPLAVLTLAGCQKPAFVIHPIGRLAPRPPAIGASSMLRFAVHNYNQRPYRVKTLDSLDWTSGDVTVSNAGTGYNRLQSFNATVDPSSDARSASNVFTGLAPTSGYSCAVRLYRPDASGAPAIVASGTNAGFTLVAGSNAVTVALSAVDQTLVIPPAAPSGATLTDSLLTHSSFSVQRLAGAPQAGLFNGSVTASDAEFGPLSGLEADASGNAYVADCANHEIRLVPVGAPGAGGAVSTLAGTGSAAFSADGSLATTAALSAPRSLLRTDAGDLFFCDSGNNRVRYISGGTLYTYAGGGADTASTVSNALDAQLNEPVSITADASADLFVAEYPSGRVSRIAANEAMSPVATFAPASVHALAVDRTRGNLWIAQGNALMLVTGANAVPAAPVSIFTVSPGIITGLAFDQSNTLYAVQTDDATIPDGAGSTQIWRIAIQANGTAQRSPAGEAIAGTGAFAGAANSAAYSVSTTLNSQALNQILASSGGAAGAFNTLAIDLSHASDGATVSGILLYSNNYLDTGAPGLWGQLLALVPQAL